MRIQERSRVSSDQIPSETDNIEEKMYISHTFSDVFFWVGRNF